jgi:formate dehydrogenase maturation protein FdhE
VPRVNWIEHAERAEALAARHKSAAEILTFYSKLARLAATEPSWDTLREWAVAHSTPELSAIAKTASQDGDTVFARVFALTGDAGYQPRVTAPSPAYCPCCGGSPGAAVLRPEADGSRRSLICGRCAYEWPYQRILCASCLEQRFEELPVYVAEEFAHLRVECCTSCKRYLVSADLLKDPCAVPLVDDIAALVLHLWASDHGYTKIEPNWFGY